jgi:protein-tyrosine phosphatase
MQRHLPFERAVNFRDMGGYPAANGHRTRWRHLFRSGHLARLTPADLAHIDSLALAGIYDFRHDSERRDEPSLCAPTSTRVMRHLPIWPQTTHNHHQLIDGWLAGTMRAHDVMALQDETYRLFVTAHTEQYRQLFTGILGGGGQPLLIHCAGGKDRTGLGAALILFALGVSEETIAADYMLSAESESLIRYVESIAAKHQSGAGDFDEAMHLFGVRRERLQCALDTACAVGGSLEGYLTKFLGVAQRERAQLQSWYLEDRS